MMQNQLDRNLRWGIILSIVWVMGVGSLLSFILGYRAKRAIKASNGTLSGIGRTWWCLVVGGLGVVLWLPVVVIGIVDQF